MRTTARTTATQAPRPCGTSSTERPGGRIGPLVTAFLLLLAGALAASPGFAQFAQYTEPGSLAQERPTPDLDAFEAAMEEAPWRLGPVRVEPWAALSDLSWVDNPDGVTEGAEGSDGDLTATGGAGVKAWLPTGPKLVWTAHALPEYTWWLDRDERNGLNGRYGAGVFGFFNRLTFDVTARREEDQRIVSSEVLRPVESRRDQAQLGLEVDLTGALSVFAGATVTELRAVPDGDAGSSALALRRLDRDESALRAGVRWKPRERWTLALGAEQSEAEFLDPGRDLSASGTAPVAEVAFSGARTDVTLSLARRSLDPEPGSGFVPYDRFTGGLRGRLQGNRLGLSVYADRSLVFSLDDRYPYGVADTLGVSANAEVGRRAELVGWVETVRRDYERAGPGIPTRRDDQLAFGAELGIDLGRSARFVLGAGWTEIDSDLPGFDRSLTTLRAGFTLGESATPWL